MVENFMFMFTANIRLQNKNLRDFDRGIAVGARCCWWKVFNYILKTAAHLGFSQTVSRVYTVC